MSSTDTSVSDNRPGTHGPILVVEDDRDILDSIGDVLRSDGYPVVLAQNGAEALASLRTQVERPCLIILDLMMPVMDGWTFRSEMRKDQALASIPVIVLSGDAHVKERAAELGCVGAVGKPISVAKLFELVEHFCCPTEGVL